MLRRYAGAIVRPRLEVTMEALARLAVRHIGAAEDSRIALEATHEGLRKALAAAVEQCGGSLAGTGEGASSGLAVIAEGRGEICPRELQALWHVVAPGGRVGLVMLDPRMAPDEGEAWGLRHGRAESHQGALVLSGVLPEAVGNAQKRRLKGLGHSLDASVQVGRPGLTDEVLGAIQMAVRRHGLVKVKLTPQCALDKREAALEIAAATGSQLIQRVGKTALIYRSDVPLEPPGRRSGRRRS